MAVRLHTNAKINLSLRVLGRRADGYHDIETVFHSVSLADELSAVASEDPFEVVMRPAGLSIQMPRAQDNIVTKAAALLGEATGKSPRGRIEITKKIPIGAGLAGGSGNAAGALVALQRQWGTNADLSALAPELGADVPFCLAGGTALATGTGEQLTRLSEAPEMWFVLGLSERPLLTGHVYEAWSPDGGAGGPPVGEILEVLTQNGSPQAVADLLHSDLEAPAMRLRPELAQKKRGLLEAGALGALVSGSGPTIFGIAADEEHARRVADGSRGNFDRVEVVHSTPACVEDVPDVPGGRGS